MTANDLFAAFETLADAPDGVKRLRELVLQLAVRGKLVAQDPQDEPASTITTELRRLRSSRRERATKDDGEARELGFELPRGWETLPLAEMCSKIGAGSTPLGGAKVYVDDGVMFLRSQNVWNDGLRLHDVARIVPDVHQRMAGTHVQPGDLLFNITGASIGRCGRVPSTFEPANVSQHVTIIRPYLATTQHFLHLVLISDVVQRRVFAEEVGVSREGLSIAKLGRFPVPLPPLAEQHRIVARVDELMGLLDRLEAARTARDDVRRAARDAALAALRDAEDTDAVEAAWGRIAGKMDALFAEPEDVGLLRQAVLELGVKGGFSPMDSGGWTRVPLRELLREPLANGRSVPDGAGFPVLRLTALRGKVVDTQFQKLGAWTEEEGSRFQIEAGDLLVVRGNGSRDLVARASRVLTTEKVAYPDTAIRVRTKPEQVETEYLHYAWHSSGIRHQLETRARTTNGIWKVSQGDLEAVEVPIPPLPEQHRIVAKVDALMALCDALEARLTTARDLHGQFAAAAVHHLDV